jgi:hypothetical protein
VECIVGAVPAVEIMNARVEHALMENVEHAMIMKVECSAMDRVVQCLVNVLPVTA